MENTNLIIFIVLFFGVYWLFGFLKRKAQDSLKNDQPQKAQKATTKQELTHIDSHEKATRQYYEKISDSISDEKYSLALKYIQKTLDTPSFSKTDDIYAEDAEQCLSELWSEKTPSAILKAYDAMLEKENSPLKYILDHKLGSSLETVLADSLENYPEIKTKASLKKAVAFFTAPHPLLQGAIEGDYLPFVELLEDACRDIFDNWDDEENDEPKEYTWEELLQEIDKRL